MVKFSWQQYCQSLGTKHQSECFPGEGAVGGDSSQFRAKKRGCTAVTASFQSSPLVIRFWEIENRNWKKKKPIQNDESCRNYFYSLVFKFYSLVFIFYSLVFVLVLNR